jgi:hypothetical protein
MRAVSIRARSLAVALSSSLVVACSAGPPSAGEPEAAQALSQAAPSGPVSRFIDTAAGGETGDARLVVRTGGRVSLPHGQLALADAFINDSPLQVSALPPGDYVVELLVAVTDDDERVAAARIRVRDDAIARWTPAGAISIDSGTGAFFDPRIPSHITPATVERFTDTLATALQASERPTYSAAAIVWEQAGLVAFSTGFGDGRYPVFVGFSTAGRPVTVLVDCEILPWPAAGPAASAP